MSIPKDSVIPPTCLPDAMHYPPLLSFYKPGTNSLGGVKRYLLASFYWFLSELVNSVFVNASHSPKTWPTPPARTYRSGTVGLKAQLFVAIQTS